LLALTHLVVLVIDDKDDDEAISDFLQYLERIPEFKSPWYMQSLNDYLQDYADILIHKFNSNPELRLAYDLLRINHSFNGIENETLVLNALKLTICNFEDSKTSIKNHMLSINALSEFFDLKHMIELYRQLYSFNKEHTKILCNHLFSFFLNEQRENEEDNDYRDRLLGMLMLNEVYNLGHNPWIYYYILMGHPRGAHQDFKKHVEENPEQYWSVMLHVAKMVKNYCFFDHKRFSNQFIQVLYENCATVIRKKKTLPQLERELMRTLVVDMNKFRFWDHISIIMKGLSKQDAVTLFSLKSRKIVSTSILNVFIKCALIRLDLQLKVVLLLSKFS
jgi:hypothetical protein